MHASCSCQNKEVRMNNQMMSISSDQISELLDKSNNALLAMAKIDKSYLTMSMESQDYLKNSNISRTFQFSQEGDALVTSTLFSQSNVDGEVVVQGLIMNFHYDLRIKVSFNKDTLMVTFSLMKPIEIGPYTFQYNFTGITKNNDGEIVSAINISPSVNSSLIKPDWLCVLKCSGISILPTLIECLPSLVGGPPAYVACVTTKLGTSDAASIALCVAKTCI